MEQPQCFSLREHIKSQGVTDEACIRSSLRIARDMKDSIPGINLRRFNVKAPMLNVMEG